MFQQPLRNGMRALLQFLLLFYGITASIIMTLSSRGQDVNNSLKLVSFCIDCPSPESEGSAVFGLVAKHSIKQFIVTGELVYCVPNFAELQRILNDKQLNNRIAFVERGLNGLLEKVIKIEKTNALGVIIADDGRCNDGYTFCGARAGSVAEGGFAAYDEEGAWKSINIPVILVNFKVAEKLRSMMDLRRVDILRAGHHNMTVTADEEEGDEEDL